MVAVVQTHGDLLAWHPHVHGLATRAGWDAEASFVPVPFVSTAAAERRRLRRSWAQLIRRIFEVDPLTCVECGSEMRILAFLFDPVVVRKILDHRAGPGRPDRRDGPGYPRDES